MADSDDERGAVDDAGLQELVERVEDGRLAVGERELELADCEAGLSAATSRPKFSPNARRCGLERAGLVAREQAWRDSSGERRKDAGGLSPSTDWLMRRASWIA